MMMMIIVLFLIKLILILFDLNFTELFNYF